MAINLFINKIVEAIQIYNGYSQNKFIYKQNLNFYSVIFVTIFLIKKSMITIFYEINMKIMGFQYMELLSNTSLGGRGPIEDVQRIEAMLKNSNLIVSASFENKLVGFVRSVTDFYYCCYLSDLAVSESYQHQGIEKS